MKYFARIAIFMFFLSPAYGQDILALQFIRPDPSSGYPMLVQTPCATSEEGEFWSSWAVPILVYSDPDLDMFIDNACIQSSVIIGGFSPNGQSSYMVALYTHYKKKSFCTLFMKDNPQIKSSPELLRECGLVFYKYRLLSVDTGKREARFAQIHLLDEDGINLTSAQNGSPVAISTLPPAIRLTITRITALLEKWYNRIARQLNDQRRTR